MAASPVVQEIRINNAGFHTIQASALEVSATQESQLEFELAVLRAGDIEKKREVVVMTQLQAGDNLTFDNFLGYLNPGDLVQASLKPVAENEAVDVQLDWEIMQVPSIPVSSFPRDWQTVTGLVSPDSWAVIAFATPDASEEPHKLSSNDTSNMSQQANHEGTVVLEVIEGDSKGTILAFEAPHSGYYALDDAWVEARSGDEIIGNIFKSSQESAIRRISFSSGDGRIDLNTDIGYLAKEDVIYLAFTCKDSAAQIECAMNVVEWAPRRAPLRVKRGQDGFLDVLDPEHPGSYIDIPQARWVNVLAQDGDASGAILQAFDQASALRTNSDEYVGIRLVAGQEYLVGTGLACGRLFELKNESRLIFDGNGATLLMNSAELQRDGIDLFVTLGCSYLAFADFIVDQQLPPPFTFGKVTKVGPMASGRQTVTFEVPPDRPDPVKDIRRDGMASGYAYDSKTPGRIVEGGWSHYPGAGGAPHLRQTSTEGAFEHVVTRTNQAISPGDLWLVKNKKAGTTYLVADRYSHDITLANVTARAPGGGLLRFWQASAINLIDCKMEPTGDHWISATSDGIHGRGRVGPWIEDTVLRGVCEDTMNIYGASMVVLSDEDAKDTVFSLRYYDRNAKTKEPTRIPDGNEVAVGDALVFFNPEEGVVIGRAQVTQIADGRFTLSHPVSGVETWSPGRGNRITMVYSNTSVGRFYIRDSSFQDSMRFGVYIKAEQGVIFNSRFEGLAATAIFAVNEPGWPEGPPASYLWLQGNAFSHNGFDFQSKNRDFLTADPAQISVYTRKLRPTEPSQDTFEQYLASGQYANSHMKFIGNTFQDWRGMGIAVRNSRNVLIADNVFMPPIDDAQVRSTLGRDPLLAEDGRGYYTAILLKDVIGARLSGNRFIGLPSGDRPIVTGLNVKQVLESDNVSLPMTEN